MSHFFLDGHAFHPEVVVSSTYGALWNRRVWHTKTMSLFVLLNYVVILSGWQCQLRVLMNVNSAIITWLFLCKRLHQFCNLKGMARGLPSGLRGPFSQFTECQERESSLMKFQPTCRQLMTALQRKKDWSTSLYSHKELSSIWRYFNMFTVLSFQIKSQKRYTLGLS